MNEYKRLLRFIRPHIWVLVLGIICAVSAELFQGISTIGTLVAGVDRIVSRRDIVLAQSGHIPEFVRNAVYALNTMSISSLLYILIAVFAAGFILWLIFEFLHSYLINMLSEKVMMNLRDMIFDKLMTLSLDFFSDTHSGKLVSRITYDVTVLKNSITQGLIDAILQPAKLIVYATLILFVRAAFGISWLWLIAPLLTIPVMVYPLRVIGKRLKKISLQMQDKMGDINIVLYEAISGIRIVKAFLMERYEMKRFADHNANFYKITMKSIKRILALRPITDGAAVLSVIFLIWLIKGEIVGGTFSFGALFAIIVALSMLMKPVKALSRVYGIAQQALAAAIRIFEILDARPSVVERPGAKTLAPITSEITFKGVSFGYKNEEKVLNGITLRVKKGEIVAIVGSSGAGKTTLVNLIPRFYDVAGGSIEIDGLDIKDATLESLRRQIGIVTQDIILFNDTVRFNIAYGRGDSAYDEARIIEAAKVANAHGFIMDMPEGYNTVIGERGTRLSGGEKQRIAIARAMFKNPPILILDEATSQLDTESEQLVQDALNRLMEGRTVFVIAHRLSTVKNATKIVTLEDGFIKEAGTHDELMRAGATYKRLYELQFKT